MTARTKITIEALESMLGELAARRDAVLANEKLAFEEFKAKREVYGLFAPETIAASMIHIEAKQALVVVAKLIEYVRSLEIATTAF